MRLLLLLSALIAGMTGMIAGPAATREPAAIATVLAAGAEQASAAAQVRRPLQQRAALASVAAPGRPSVPALMAQTHPVNERRNE